MAMHKACAPQSWKGWDNESKSFHNSFFLCKELIPGYLDGITGVYQTPQGYYVDDAEVEEFDQSFPPKVKLKLPGQLV